MIYTARILPVILVMVEIQGIRCGEVIFSQKTLSPVSPVSGSPEIKLAFITF